MRCSPALANPRLQSRLPGGAQLRVIASIEEPEIVERILNHLGGDSGTVDPGHPSQAPPPPDRLL